MPTNWSYPNCSCCGPPVPSCGNCPVFASQWKFTVSQVCQPVFATASCAPEPNPCSQAFKREWVLDYIPTLRQACSPGQTVCWFRSQAIPYSPPGFPSGLYAQWYMRFVVPSAFESPTSAITAIISGHYTSGPAFNGCVDNSSLFIQLVHRGPLNCMGCNYFFSGSATTWTNFNCNLFPTFSGVVEFNVCPLLN